eukprot:2586165-Pyramimonas_sp.AAC.1
MMHEPSSHRGSIPSAASSSSHDCRPPSGSIALSPTRVQMNAPSGEQFAGTCGRPRCLQTTGHNWRTL